ncbi:cation transporter [Thioalkalivibrio versutus]|uniref:Cation transporter n=1 Tax=Thioalkalivibrio versutus TaxID=106634 RepID=A0A0G3G2U1_9GAMM|nr:Na+/H+ antiporter subunit E [Thioalkalivibrio versutus]AKJ95540.1 cation transporter [Thioalkalivibrio versutus]
MTPASRSSQPNPGFPGRARSRGRRAIGTAAAAALLWWVLAGHEALLEPLALLAIVLAGSASLLLPTGRPLPLRLRALPDLLGFFLRNSFLGGLDVARRALDPRLPIQPAFVTYRTELAHGPPLTLFMAVISLLPGTLSIRLEGRLLTLHVLDRDADTRAALIALERRIRAAFRDPRDHRDKRNGKTS